MNLLIIDIHNLEIIKKIPLSNQRRKTVFDVKEKVNEELHVFYKFRIRLYDLKSFTWKRTIPKLDDTHVSYDYDRRFKLQNNIQNNISLNIERYQNLQTLEIHSNAKISEIILETNKNQHFIEFIELNNTKVIIHLSCTIYIVDYFKKLILAKINGNYEKIIGFGNDFICFRYDGITKYKEIV